MEEFAGSRSRRASSTATAATGTRSPATRTTPRRRCGCRCRPGYGLAATGDLVTVVTPPDAEGDAALAPVPLPRPAAGALPLVPDHVAARREARDGCEIGSLVEPFRALRRPGVYYDDVMLTGRAQPRLKGRARDLAKTPADILRFYASLIGDAPYPTLTLAVVERPLPGGHSPAYLAVVTQPSPASRLTYRDDPAVVLRLPGVLPRARAGAPVVGTGGRLEELPRAVDRARASPSTSPRCTPRRRAAPACSASVMRRMRALRDGPVGRGPDLPRLPRRPHPGRQPGLPRRGLQQGARSCCTCCGGLVGDEVFFRGVRRFYDDVAVPEGRDRRLPPAMEAEAGQPLGRFFERWIYGDTLPQVAFTWREAADVGGGPVRRGRARSSSSARNCSTSRSTVTRRLRRPGRRERDRCRSPSGRPRHRMPLLGTVRSIEANRDGMALVLVRK